MITDFLKTTTSKEKLAIALEVLYEYVEYESIHEYCDTDRCINLQQFREYLEHLVNDRPLLKDVLAQLRGEKI